MIFENVHLIIGFVIAIALAIAFAERVKAKAKLKELEILMRWVEEQKCSITNVNGSWGVVKDGILLGKSNDGLHEALVNAFAGDSENGK